MLDLLHRSSPQNKKRNARDTAPSQPVPSFVISCCSADKSPQQLSIPLLHTEYESQVTSRRCVVASSILYAMLSGIPIFVMPKRSSINQNRNIERKAARLLSQLVGEPLYDKNPYAVLLGRAGGLKGGPARAKKLTRRRRREIARGAANARWNKKK